MQLLGLRVKLEKEVTDPKERRALEEKIRMLEKELELD
jgi:hypothetical protein